LLRKSKNTTTVEMLDFGYKKKDVFSAKMAQLEGKLPL